MHLGIVNDSSVPIFQGSSTPHAGYPGPPIEDGLPIGPSLGNVLSVGLFIFTVFYIIGMIYKLIKIYYLGTYEEKSPVYLLYK